MGSPRRERLHGLATKLDALASPTRLELLHLLREPAQLSEIRVYPSLTREGENPDRPLSRQSVTHHLDTLTELGLVDRVVESESGRGDQFVLNHERVFVLVDDLRTLAKLRPVLNARDSLDVTRQVDDDTPLGLPPPPRLLVTYGREDGLAYPLATGAVGRTVGRSAYCDIVLDYDPYVSGEHCRVEATGDGFQVRDLESRNGTWVNWHRLDPGATQALAPGDALTIGRSVLVLQL